MSEILKQRWFMVSLSNFPQTYYICCGENYQQAEKSFVNLRPRSKITQLTWRQLSELTGCLIPCQCKPKDLANGKLMFMRKGSFVTVW